MGRSGCQPSGDKANLSVLEQLGEDGVGRVSVASSGLLARALALIALALGLLGAGLAAAQTPGGPTPEDYMKQAGPNAKLIPYNELKLDGRKVNCGKRPTVLDERQRERYFEEGDYRSAFPHYLAVAESGNATNIEAASSLTRLGWMAFEGNGEVETATRLLDQALAIEPGAPVALYLKGRVQWCGSGDNQSAVDLFEQVLDTPDLPADSRSEVEADLEMARAGEACP